MNPNLTEAQTQIESLEMLTKMHLMHINQLNEVIVNQRNQIAELQKTADSSVKTINAMSKIIGEQQEKYNQLKLKTNRLKQGQFVQNSN